MNLARFGIVWLAGSLASPAAPSPSPPPTLPPGDRFLFVVDTSAGMASLAKACRQAVFDLIWTGLGGYMQPGDTYGLWTFNEEVQKSRLPIQIWGTNALELASVAGRFLRDQPYKGSSHPEAAIATLKPTVQLVRDLVVILITDGRAPIAGTPFDAALQAACKQASAQARRLRQPLLVVLAARGGEWVRWSVHLPGQSLALPQRVSQPAAITRASPGAASTNALARAATTNWPPPTRQPTGAVILTPISPPLVPSHASAATPTNVAEPTETTVFPAATNTPPEQPESELPPAAAQLEAQPQQPANPGPPPAEPAQASSPKPPSPDHPNPEQPVAEPTPQPGSNETVRPPLAPNPADAALSRSLPTSPWVAPARTAAPPVVLRPKNSALVAAPAKPGTDSAGSALLTGLVSQPPDRTLSLPGLSPETVHAREPRPPLAAAPTPAAAVPAASSQPTARATAASALFKPWVMLAIGLGLLLGALILTVVFLRRVQPRSRPSIISQSLDRTGNGSRWG